MNISVSISMSISISISVSQSSILLVIIWMRIMAHFVQVNRGAIRRISHYDGKQINTNAKAISEVRRLLFPSIRRPPNQIRAGLLVCPTG